MTSVDVVIPVRNGARFLPACLDSVLAQTYPVHHIIVVDDGSEDDTPGVICEYARRSAGIRPIRTDARGVSHARNAGIRASSADTIAFIDSDDIWRPEKLECQMPLLDRSPGVAFVHCGYFNIDENGRVLEGISIHAPSRRGDVFRDLIGGYQVSGSASAVVARRELLLQAGGFDETLAHAEDLDVWLKLARLGELDYVSAALVGIRDHAGSVQRRPDRKRDETDYLSRLRVFEKWMGVARSETLLAAYRSQAVRTGVMRIIFRFRFGFFRRMRAHAPLMTHAMFKEAADYAAAVRPALVREVRSLLAHKVIAKSVVLIRLCQMFGRLKGLKVDHR